MNEIRRHSSIVRPTAQRAFAWFEAMKKLTRGVWRATRHVAALYLSCEASAKQDERLNFRAIHGREPFTERGYTIISQLRFVALGFVLCGLLGGDGRRRGQAFNNE